MFTKKIMMFSAVALLVGCTSPIQLNSAGAQVEFIDTKPDSQCQFLGEVRGSQSNLFSGDRPESASMRNAANDLRNKAAAIGGNVVYHAGVVDKSRWSDFAPLPSEMVGLVYKCPTK